jgi:peptidoglycan L-alanyl-D-glutamate endopeptidase CwlK
MTERNKRMLSELDAAARPVFEDFLRRLDEALGENQYIVFEGRRSVRTQEAYYAQGRKPLDEVNALRKGAGLYLLRGEKDNYVITWTLKSKHIEGLAMDVLPRDGAGSPTWDLAHYRGKFEVIRDCGFAAGLVCGGDWPAPQTDWPHYETP